MTFVHHGALPALENRYLKILDLMGKAHDAADELRFSLRPGRPADAGIRALEDWKAACEEVDSRPDVSRAEQEADRWDAAVNKIEMEIIDTPASTIEDIAVKLRLAVGFESVGPEALPDELALRSALADCERLSGRAAS